MEGATHFIEVYKYTATGKIFHSPNILRNEVHSFPMAQLKGDLEFTKRMMHFETIAVWYIKPLVKSKLTP